MVAIHTVRFERARGWTRRTVRLWLEAATVHASAIDVTKAQIRVTLIPRALCANGSDALVYLGGGVTFVTAFVPLA